LEARILAIIVAYHPEVEVLENLRVLLKQVTHCVVVDNESSTRSIALLKQLGSEQITVLENKENRGIAGGVNDGLRWGLSQGFEYFLLMDQDSRATEGMVRKVFTTLNDFEGQGKYALVGPQHEDFNYKIKTKNASEVEKVELLITSGSMVSKRLIEFIGFYDERLFIDHVDHDYCLRLKKRGGMCFKVNSAVLLHRFGQASRVKFLGKSFFLQEYSPFRRYHMMRNRIVLYKRYGFGSGEWFWMDLRNALKDFIKLIFFEQNRFLKLKSWVHGLRDGLTWVD
jgi:rhamnosyltransferase